MNAPVLPPGLRQRIDRQLEICEAARALASRRRTPYLAHMRLRTELGEKDFLLATETRTGEEVSLLHWLDAPLSTLFFEFSEGEEYELAVSDRLLTGTLLERNLVGFEDGELVELVTPDAVLSRRGGGRWREVTAERPRLLPASRAAAREAGAAIDVVLDPAQRRVVELPPGRSVLILGEAGCGKTTVAVHRLAALMKQHPNRRLKAAVIVPTEALRRLTEMWLQRLGLAGVTVWLYDRFAAQQARRVFRGLPRREGKMANALTIRLKRDPALRVALEELAARPPAQPDEDAFRFKSKALATREDLHHLFGDRALLAKVTAAGQALYPVSTLPETVDHTRIQFSLRSETEYAQVTEADRTAAVDLRELDEGTPMEDAQSIDVEDYAVLFELERLRALRAGKRPALPPQHDLIVVDEAQEFAPLELALIGRSVARNGTLVVAGDAEQQVDVSAAFSGWDDVMHELGAADHERATLQVSYRCPPEVVTVAQRIRSDRPSAVSAQPASTPHALGHVRFDHEAHLTAWAIDVVRELLGRSARASIAVICRTREAAISTARMLRRGLHLQLALDGEFEFGGGLNVTAVEEVKGLEFDHVILPDASAASYPDTQAARRALYVAVTRASRQLVLASVGPGTPLVEWPAAGAKPGQLTGHGRG